MFVSFLKSVTKSVSPPPEQNPSNVLKPHSVDFCKVTKNIFADHQYASHLIVFGIEISLLKSSSRSTMAVKRYSWPVLVTIVMPSARRVSSAYARKSVIVRDEKLGNHGLTQPATSRAFQLRPANISQKDSVNELTRLRTWSLFDFGNVVYGDREDRLQFGRVSAGRAGFGEVRQ